MRALFRGAVAGLLRYREKAAGRPLHYIFLLGHMRSGSTLLNHILMSSPEILGCGERNAYYANDDDLMLFGFRTHLNRRRFPGSYRYVVDQINHNKFLRDLALLNDPRVRTIFLIREPAPTIASMANLFGRFYGTGRDEVLTSYLDRLEGLSRSARSLKARANAALVTYDDLIHDTSATLEGLRTFLGLRTPLSESYERFDFTGRRGDPGPKIQLGRVSRDPPVYPVDLSSGELSILAAAHARCLATVGSNSVRASGTGAPGRAREASRTSRGRSEPSIPPAASV